MTTDKRPSIGDATDFIWRTARLIDRCRFSYHFLDGDRTAVVGALRPYQNPDGGFGHALEPDLRCPLSQPVPTWTALTVLDEVDAFTDPMVASACEYLQRITTPEGGVPFVLASARGYPHAPWWEAGEEPAASLNPTAAIAALLHKHHIDHPWLVRATAYCWQEMDTIDVTSPYTFRAVLPFLEYAPDRQRAEAAFERIGSQMRAHAVVALDPDAPGEVHTPLDFAPRPDSMARRLFTDNVIGAHLDAVVSAQQPDGGWRFNFPEWNPLTTLEWRGWLTTEQLRLLRAYARLP
ncbi:MAG: hypothetical protein ACR2HB_10920 [Dehalococcoidia bacterium]